jgi:threonyl-tRNA synthetase
MKKIPYMCIIGKNEAAEGKVTLRQHTVGDLGSMSLEAAMEALRQHS